MSITFKKELLHKKLFKWWKDNKREFSWRKTKDPYKILVAEILLHRTKAAQVLKIYNNFVEVYPDFQSIANSNFSDIEIMLYSLGLKWRTDKLFQMSMEIVKKYDGQIPLEKDSLLKLPGVSEYIASAYRSFTFNLPEVLLDTNTVRIVGRLFNLEITDSSRRNKAFRNYLLQLIDLKRSRDFNYALLDLGASICTSRNPKCNKCPLIDFCSYPESS